MFALLCGYNFRLLLEEMVCDTSLVLPEIPRDFMVIITLNSANQTGLPCVELSS